MLYNYHEAITAFGSNYQMNKAINRKELWKVEKGIYSDQKSNFSCYELIAKKYPNSFLVKDSALFYIGFIDKEPERIHIGTPRNALRIRDKRIQQHFYSNLDRMVVDSRYGYAIKHILCYQNIKTYVTENQNIVRILDLQALLFDLLRDQKNYSKQAITDILYKFAGCSVFTELDDMEFEENMINENVFLNEEFDHILSEIISRTRDRRFDKRFKSLFD